MSELDPHVKCRFYYTFYEFVLDFRVSTAFLASYLFYFAIFNSIVICVSS